MDDLQAWIGLAGAPVVAGLVESLVKPFIADARFYPLAAIVLGVAWNVGLGLVLHHDLAVASILGIMSGLAASGVYSAQKAVRSPA